MQQTPLTIVKVGPWFGLAFLGLLVLLVALSVAQGHRLAARRKTFDLERTKLFGRTTELLDNREVLLAHERRESFLDRLHGHAQDLARLDRRLVASESSYGAIGAAITDAGRLGILALVIYFSVRGADVNSVGDGYFYVSLFARVVSPVTGILSGFDELFRSTATSTTLLDVVDRRDERPVAGGKKPDPPEDSSAPAIELKGVHFSYADRPVLEDVSFSIPRGGLTLVVGPSGIGKTTIARLILGFQTPTTGQVRVYGTDVREWDWTHLLLQCSYGAQTKHVLNETIRENLFPSNGVDDLELVKALADVGLGSIELDRVATELSEGQRQRLALARILLDKAPIVVLDEPLSGVDTLTFAEVRNQLQSWVTGSSQSHTVVLISHRLAFASLAKHVVVLGEDGHVLEEGEPDLLLRKDAQGPFAKMWAASSVIELGT